MANKTTTFNETGIKKLPNNKPVLGVSGTLLTILIFSLNLKDCIFVNFRDYHNFLMSYGHSSGGGESPRSQECPGNLAARHSRQRSYLTLLNSLFCV